MILRCFQQFIQLCGKTDMKMPRDAFLTALCKACLPPKFAMSLITSHRAVKSGPQDQGSPEKKGVEIDPGGNRGGVEGGGAKKKLVFPGDSVSGGGVAGGGEGGGGKPTTPTSGQKGIQSSLVIQVTLNYICCRFNPSPSSLPPPFLSPSPSFLSFLPSLRPSLLLLLPPLHQVTVKNLQCTECLLQIIGNHGNLLDTAWLLVLTAVQVHLVTVLLRSQR